MTHKEKLLAAQLLTEIADHCAYRNCNGFKFPVGWTQEDRERFFAEYNSWNGEPWTFTYPRSLNLPDVAVMSFLAFKLACEVGAVAKVEEDKS